MNSLPRRSTRGPATTAAGSGSRRRSSATRLALVVAAAPLGCVGGEEPRPVAAPETPYVNADELERLATTSTGPTLLEFCVPVGCSRCDAMRRPIDSLAQDERDHVTVRRVNLNTERRLAARWGVRVCPTYIVVAEGREVGRAEYPTSADLVAALIPHRPAVE